MYRNPFQIVSAQYRLYRVPYLERELTEMNLGNYVLDSMQNEEVPQQYSRVRRTDQMILQNSTGCSEGIFQVK